MGGMGVGTKSMLDLLGLRDEQELAKRKETVRQAEGRAGSWEQVAVDLGALKELRKWW